MDQNTHPRPRLERRSMLVRTALSALGILVLVAAAGMVLSGGGEATSVPPGKPSKPAEETAPEEPKPEEQDKKPEQETTQRDETKPAPAPATERAAKQAAPPPADARVRSPLPPKKGPASRRRAAPKTRKRRGKAARAATKAAGKPAAPVTLPTPGHDRYRIRFTSDEALAAVVRDGRAWAHACSSRGSLYLVPPSATGGVALVASECSPAVQAKHGLRPLERPTAALRRALGGIDTEGFRWFLRLERRLAARVEALLAGSPSDGSAKPLVEIDERGEVRLVRKGERMAAR